jgi:hypothetical protein
LGSQNVLEVNEPVLIVRPDDGPAGLKHVALYILLMVTTDVLEENINTLFKHVVMATVSQLDLAIKVMQISGSWTLHVYHHSNTLYICIYLLPMSHFVPLLPLPPHHHLNKHTEYLDSDQPDIWSQSAK